MSAREQIQERADNWEFLLFRMALELLQLRVSLAEYRLFYRALL